MKYAIVGELKQEAQSGLSGECPVCRATTIAKCGEKYIWHWAHKGKRNCDHWWENETKWHRNWKNQFPAERQEVVQIADDGEKHIADVKTGQGCVIEFQHSYIKPEERRSREAFYGSMVWVVDGLRRKNDLKKFIEAVRGERQIFKELSVISVRPSDCRLVKDWSTSRVPVFFDFGEKIQPHGLWLLIPMGLDHTTYMIRAGKEDFIGWYRKDGFDFQPLIDQMKAYEQEKHRANEALHASQRMPMPMPYKTGTRRPQSFQQYMSRKQLSRKRF